jgi:hypothetical protein
LLVGESANTEVAELVKSVLLDEMVHLLLAANLLNPVGGFPLIDSPGFLPRYPTTLPFSDGSFQVPPAALLARGFLGLPPDRAPGGGGVTRRGRRLRYDRAVLPGALEGGLLYLAATLGKDVLFSGDPVPQIGPEMIGVRRAGGS